MDAALAPAAPDVFEERHRAHVEKHPRAWINTNGGRQIWPMAVRPRDIWLADAAHAMAWEPRYGGHPDQSYSVGQHSVLVARVIYQRTKSIPLARAGLVHDVPEGLGLKDIPGPIKFLPEFAPYREAEDWAMRAVCARVEVPWPLPEIVHEVDSWIVNAEAPQIFTAIHPAWRERRNLMTFDEARVQCFVRPWPAEQARIAWLTEFERLFPSRLWDEEYHK